MVTTNAICPAPLASQIGRERTLLLTTPPRWPWKKQDYVALKITNSSPATRAAARRELEVCKQFSSRRTTHPGRRYVREIINHFEIDGPGGKHLCLAFEPVRQPLWMLTQQLRREGLALSQSLKTLLPSILQCLDYLHSECHIIHTGIAHFRILC